MNNKRLKEIIDRRAELRSQLDGEGEVDLGAIESELDSLEAEEAELRQMQQRSEVAARIDRGEINPEPAEHLPNPLVRSAAPESAGGLPAGVDSRAAWLADLQGVPVHEAESRAQEFASSNRMTITPDALERSLTLTTGQIAQPTRVSGINPMQNEVSGIIDMVRVVNATGYGEDLVAYEVSGMGTTDHADDGSAVPAESIKDNYKIAKIKPHLISTIGYVSKRIQRTTPLNYAERTSGVALRALRRDIARKIVSGAPDFVSIVNAEAITADSDVEISAIDERTLRRIALAYGGDDNVEGGGLLLLNKKDLIALGDVRGNNEKKYVYEIDFDNTSTTVGTIKDGGLAVRFCINNELPSLAETSTGEYSMIYGKPLAYQLDLFGPYTIEVSRDYKFAEGLLAVMGEAMVGGNVITQNGFIRVKKA